MKTIFIDTSTSYSRAVLVNSGEVYGEVSIKCRPLKGIHRQIEDLLDLVDTDIKDIACVAVSIGPGSWTGIHIALTTAKTLSQVLDIPLLPITELELIAWSNHSARKPVYAMIDARHDHIYFAQYACTSDTPMEVGEPRKVAFSTICDQIRATKEPVIIAGNGYQANANFFSQLSDIQNCEIGYHIPEATAIAKAIACNEGRTLKGKDMMGVEALYLIPEGEGPQLGAWNK